MIVQSSRSAPRAHSGSFDYQGLDEDASIGQGTRWPHYPVTATEWLRVLVVGEAMNATAREASARAFKSLFFRTKAGRQHRSGHSRSSGP